MARRSRRNSKPRPKAGEKIQLGGGQYMVIRSDLTMQDLDDISDMARRYDEENRVHYTDEAHGAAEAIGVLIEEWSLDPPCEATPENFRALPINLGMRIRKIISDFLVDIRKEAHGNADSPEAETASAN